MTILIGMEIVQVQGILPNGVPSGGLFGATTQQIANLSINASEATLLPNWRTALTSAQTGMSDAKILIVGDSTSAGLGSSGYPTQPNIGSWPSLLAARLNKIVNCYESYTGSSGIGTDTQIAFSGPSSGFGGSLGFANIFMQGGSTANNTITYTPAGGNNYDTFDVYYENNGASFTVTATGGSPVTVNTNSTKTIGKQTVSAGSLATNNSCVITVVSGGVTRITGFEPRNSTQVSVRIWNAGVSGAAAASISPASVKSWASGITGSEGIGADSIACIKAYAPHLTIIMLGINDAIVATPPNSFTSVKTALQSLITAGKVSGDAIIMSFYPSQASTVPQYPTEVSYQSMFGQLANANNIPILDIWGRFNGTWYSPMSFNNVHPNSLGYQDFANFIYPILIE